MGHFLRNEKLDKEALMGEFNHALETKAAFIGVRIETRGMEKPEYIINPYENIAQKLIYYNSAYNNDLVLKTYDGIRITRIAHGDSTEEIMKWLGAYNEAGKIN